ncbi:hypothetical protein HNR77_001457 [Paenibacillus sp. JGP012]|uniref:hypothetical protein n=1 Tax=Paenibacillus sp. JGP012 TaxID=2735914 RepID=UPI0016151581|nr:hypothetical protein [Paenibacillus sp. JGP012]MBB6020396.1 hypothetical protein [Paenibacillus sp. JGP012]
MYNKQTYEQIIEFIQQHREIEFEYENKQYAFLAVKDGFVLVCDNKTQGPVFVDYEEMVKESRINGHTFLDLFKSEELTITAVL